MTSTITLTARELTALVAPVIPHADDGVTPILNAVRIRSNGPWVTAMASDRYRIGLQRVRPAEPPGEGFDAVVRLSVLARIRSVFKATRSHDPVLTLTLDGALLRVGAVDTLDGLVGATLDFHLPTDLGEWPPALDRLLREALTSTAPGDARRVMVNPVFLADFKVGQPAHAPLLMSPTGDETKAWVIRVGDDFAGLLVPIRGGSEPDATGWADLLGSEAKASEVAA